MKKWILEHRKIVTSAIIIFSIASMVIISILFWTFQKNPKMKCSELLYYSSQVVSAIFVISGVVIAVWQYYLSYIDSKTNVDIIRVQKAIDLSEYYKDNILAYFAPINFILVNSGISDILSKIDDEKIKHFDQKELEVYLSQVDIQEIKKIQESEKFFEVVVKADYLYNLGLDRKMVYHYLNKNSQRPLSPLDSEMFSRFLGKLITKSLNNMEYFALHFTHNVADESVVYKSLHQTYIDMVRMLYYNIAIKNPLSPKKYFTNIIELYEVWNKRALEDEEEFANGVRNLSNKGTVVENK